METNNGLVPFNGGVKKSNWEKPGGTLGMICAGLAIGGGLILLYHILPFLIALASNVLYLILMLAAIGILGYILTSKRFWHTFGLAYFIIMRKITGVFISIDPVSILDQYIQDLEKKIKEVDKNVIAVRGLINKNERRIKDVTDKLKDALAKKKYYENNGQANFALQINGMIVLYEKSKTDREARLETSKKWLDALVKLSKYANFNVGINREKVQLLKDEYEEIKESGKAFRSIKAAINGDPDIMSDFEMAVEVMENEITYNLGEIDGMIDETNGLLGQADIETAVTSSKAQDILNKYEKAEGIFSEQHWNNQIESKPQPNLGESLKQAEPIKQNSSNNNYF